MRIKEVDFGLYRTKCQWCMPALEDNSFRCLRNREDCSYSECPLIFSRSDSRRFPIMSTPSGQSTI